MIRLTYVFARHSPLGSLPTLAQDSWRGISVALISLLVASVTAQALALVSAINEDFMPVLRSRPR